MFSGSQSINKNSRQRHDTAELRTNAVTIVCTIYAHAKNHYHYYYCCCFVFCFSTPCMFFYRQELELFCHCLPPFPLRLGCLLVLVLFIHVPWHAFLFVNVCCVCSLYTMLFVLLSSTSSSCRHHLFVVYSLNCNFSSSSHCLPTHYHSTRLFSSLNWYA